MKITGVSEVHFTVPKNATTREIALLLKKERLIIDPFGFTAIVRAMKVDKSLKSGQYNAKNIQSIYDIIYVLETGTPQKEIKVTIPEGFTVFDIAERLYEKGIISDKEAFIKKATPFEGYLFPDTYMFTENEDIEKIIQKMRNHFYEMRPKDFATKVKEKGLTEKQAIILASIVEKEAKFDRDRPLVASVFLNRLNADMLLQSDATINYVLKEKKLWLSKKDLGLDSPYNTYKYKGLPPTPICNPGIASIKAVMDAPKTDYYYFLSKPNGETVFEKTLEEHNRDISKYYGG